MALINLLAGEQQNFLPIIIIGVVLVAFVVMTFMNNKQRKKQMAEEQLKKDNLSKGAKIITIGGIMGTVVSVNHKKSTFVLKTSNSQIEFDMRAIYQVVSEEVEQPKETTEVETEEPKALEVEEVKTEEVKAEEETNA